jgi:hypothetical protein
MPQVKIAADGARTTMLSTGKVEPVALWVNNQRTGEQRTDDKGRPLWAVEVLMGLEDDDARTERAAVEVPAERMPEPRKLTPVEFSGLAVTVYVDRAGGLRCRWSAEGVRHDAKPQAA